MNADDLDRAADIAEAERAFAEARHRARASSPIPLCEECGERHVHVATNGLRWRYCAPCAFELKGVTP